MLIAVAVALATVAIVIVLATRFGTHVTKLVGSEDRESLLLGVLGLTLLVAGIADQLKVSAAVGAFLVGIAVSGTVAENAVEVLAPLRDLFAAVFFVTFGLSTAAGTLLPVLPLAVAAHGAHGVHEVRDGLPRRAPVEGQTTRSLARRARPDPARRVLGRHRRAGRRCRRRRATRSADRRLRAAHDRARRSRPEAAEPAQRQRRAPSGARRPSSRGEAQRPARLNASTTGFCVSM